MIKGIQRNMVVLKNTGSPIFEEAYFILRERPGTETGKNDMVSEASRIIAANMISPEKLIAEKSQKARERFIRLLIFALGAISGGMLSALVVLLL